MRVFLSWSGEQSRLLAHLLRDWLPNVIQSVQPWLAAADIAPGTAFSSEIGKAIGQAEIGIVCLTRANLQAPWLNYEVGMMSVGGVPIIPLTLDLSPGEIVGALAQFQAAAVDKEGMRRVVDSINTRAEHPVGDKLLSRAFDLFWPDFERNVSVILNTSVAGAVRTWGEVASAQPTVEMGDLARSIQALTEMVSQMRDRMVSQEIPPPSGGASLLADGGKPMLFIGSSVEGKRIAECIQATLEHEVESTLWTQGIFQPSSTTIESLVDQARLFNYAVIVLTPDDVLIKRGVEHRAPRDNLLFEVGLFTGMLGRARTFIVHPRNEDLDFPTDFRGVTMIDFDPNRADKNLLAAIGPACTRMKAAMGLL
jgi:hypothetical protein